MRAALFLLIGCGGTSFEGTVVDHTGKPMEGALVTVVGNLCQSQTDAAGAFAIGCNSAKGSVTLSAGQTGFVSAETTVQVGDKTAYPVGSLELIGIPEGEGLFWREGADDKRLESGHIVKDVVQQPEAIASYCLVEGAPVNALASTELVLFDKGHEGWRLWRVDDEGCVYKKRRVDRGQWERISGDKLQPAQRDLGGHQELATLTLESGRYWIGEWGNGFFAPDRSIDGPVHYKGYLLEVP